MPPESLEKQFIQRMRQLLVALPYDMKVLFEAISDENLPMPARQLAAGAAIYCLSPSDPIPDSTGLLGYCDDVVVVRIALKRFLELGGEDAKTYPERFAEQFGRLDKTLLKARYKGKDALTYIQEDEACEFLYEEGQDFTTRYEIDDEAVARLQSGKPVVEAFRRRMAEEARMQG